MAAIYVLKKVIDYKNPEMLSKFTSQNGRILSLKNTNKSIWKNIFKIYLFKKKKLKTRSSEYRGKRTSENLESFEVTIYIYSPNARNSYNTLKNITKLRTIKK